MDERTRRRSEPGEPLITDVELRGLVAASSLTPTQRGTLLMMADGLYRDDLRIIMGIGRLAIALGLGRSATIARIRSLESTGVIVKTRGGGGRAENGKGYVNIWEFRPDALRAQADACAEVHAPESKGTACGTVNGAWNGAQGSGLDASTVRATAHDPTVPIPPTKESNKDCTAGAADIRGASDGGLIRRRRKHPGDLRPWVNRFDAPRQTRADRLDQLRAQIAVTQNKRSREGDDPVNSTTEGEH